jgi:anaerobic ribonucleoside-triphosphate reductase activating protein
MWDKSGGKEYDTSEIISLIKAYKDKIEGITFLGGEPTEQIDAVIDISKKVQKLGLSVLVFTGHTYKELEQKSKFNELIKYVDILIDGRFEKEKLDYSRAWVGSSNQNYYFLTDRYNKSVIYNYKNKIEVRIKPNSQIVMTGMGDFEQAIKAVL